MIAIQISWILQEPTARIAKLSRRKTDFYLGCGTRGLYREWSRQRSDGTLLVFHKANQNIPFGRLYWDHIVIHHNWEKSSTFYGSSKIEASLETIYHNQIPITKYPVLRSALTNNLRYPQQLKQISQLVSNKTQTRQRLLP